MDLDRLTKIARAAEAIVQNIDALRSTKAHRLGCDCTGSPDKVHTCKSFMEAYEALKKLFPAKEYETNLVRALEPGDTIIG